MSDTPDWAQGTNDGIHKFPNQPPTNLPDPGPIGNLLKNLIESMLRQLVLKIVGVLLPGPAGAQLSAFFNTVFDNIEKVMGMTPGQLLSSLNPSAVWQNIVQAFINPLGFFANLVGGFVSQFQIPILDPSKILGLPAALFNVQKMIDDTVSTWTGIISAGNPITAFFNAIFGINATAQGASASVEVANSALAINSAVAAKDAAVAAGITAAQVVSDTWDGPGRVDAGLNYTTFSSGPGGGYPLVQDGRMVWFSQGTLDRFYGSIFTAQALATNYQMVTGVFQGRSQNASNAADFLVLRSDVTGLNRVQLRIEYAMYVLQSVVAGVVTNMHTPVTLEIGEFDIWAVRAGTAADVNEFQIYRNNGLVNSFIDATGSVSGASNRFVGVALYAGSTFFQQSFPAASSCFAGADRTP